MYVDEELDSTSAELRLDTLHDPTDADATRRARAIAYHLYSSSTAANSMGTEDAARNRPAANEALGAARSEGWWTWLRGSVSGSSDKERQGRGDTDGCEPRSHAARLARQPESQLVRLIMADGQPGSVIGDEAATGDGGTQSADASVRSRSHDELVGLRQTWEPVAPDSVVPGSSSSSGSNLSI